ncbi:hypothetical protein CAEBREN_03861 [Caenorhabditis brenneri]|uniref:Uncharacterized protein n=1 Tax=Caenorhabditis brenneri TaxID=135651 RepID=G0P1D9_CAEBE|nr:hypothetical protein CAEBREN_03861 [Caenorhabditis brenneri]
MCLDGLQKAEKFKRQEFAEACLDTGEAGRALKKMKQKKLKKLKNQLEKGQLEAKLRMQIADGMMEKEDKKLTETEKLAMKGRYKDKALGKLNEAAKVAEEMNQIELRSIPRKHKYGGIFTQQQASNIMWSPADTVVHHLVDQAIVAERKLWHEVRVATLDEIYR